MIVSTMPIVIHPISAMITRSAVEHRAKLAAHREILECDGHGG
jgi:hypothetical protein